MEKIFITKRPNWIKINHIQIFYKLD